MPTYEYACPSCGHRFETFQSMKAKPLSECPSCDAADLRRVIGLGAGIIFKGSGFYQTDYRKDSKSADGEKPSSDSDSSGKKSGGESAASSNGAKKETTSSANS